MTFTLRIFSARPDYETLPVAKITHYPLTESSYKPYAQGRICASSEGLHLHMLSFEAQSFSDSCLCGVVRLRKDAPAFVGKLYADGRFSGEFNGVPMASVRHTPLAGEDMQGVFWGGVITFPLSAFSQEADGSAFSSGKTLWGNFYKICEDLRRPHYGSFIPADFHKPLEDADNLGLWKCIVF